MPIRPSRDINFVNSPGGLVGLSIEKATSENAGQYTLTVVNKLGEASSVAEVIYYYNWFIIHSSMNYINNYTIL